MNKEYHKALFSSNMFKPPVGSMTYGSRIRPIAVTPRRMFSSNPEDETSRGRFFDFLRGKSSKKEPEKEIEKDEKQEKPE